MRAGSPGPLRDLHEWREAAARAAADPDGFWLGIARDRLAWRKAPTVGLLGSYRELEDGPFSWFSDGVLNVTESCLDRHLATRGEKTALLWEGDDPSQVRRISYRELHAEVCRAAGALTALGVRKGERVVIYMGMVPEAVVAMLACARIGAIHSVVFGGFSAEALRDRVRDSGAELVITQDEAPRHGKPVRLKAMTDEALEGEHGVKKVLCLRHTGAPVGWVEGRDAWWHEALEGQPDQFPAVPCAAEDPLFILYTSGSTGRP